MIPARSMVRVLATLLLSATRLEAFSLHPVHRRGAGSKATVHSSAASAVARRGTSVAVAPSMWTGVRGRARCTALGMSMDAVAEVTVADLEDREFQLEELEDKDVAETSLVLNKDGSITAGATNGPIPLNVRGKWTFDGKAFRLDLHREFDAAIPYVVSRVMKGYVEEVLAATDTLIITGDIEMDGMDVGFFKMISAPSDIIDSLKHLDEQLASKKNDHQPLLMPESEFSDDFGYGFGYSDTASVTTYDGDDQCLGGCETPEYIHIDPHLRIFVDVLRGVAAAQALVIPVVLGDNDGDGVLDAVSGIVGELLVDTCG
eukprot:g11398.t1